METNDGRLFAKSWTPGALASTTPMVLFHDSLGCVDLWRDFPNILADRTGRRVIAYDRLGFGRSDAQADPVQLDFIASEGKRLLPMLAEKLDFREFLACGHSVGGGMAIETAARMPDVCKAAITIAAQAFVEEQTLDGIRQAKMAFTSPEALSRLRKYHGAKTEWVLRAWIDTWLFEEFAGWDLDEALERMRCSLLVIHGDRDEYGSITHPRRLTAFGGTMCILEDIGHTPHRDHPELLADAIAGWLQSQ
ncbi:alpha/beta fold hydrolase [Agrobacterium pusense]|uniref:alpha/beta fold hydrolase n=1 Tax=Agrobacterium pusense TaxID=648995 RepID=UPI001F1F5559|nr:alpha/beta hydrolase [Agrobacterium pusense]